MSKKSPKSRRKDELNQKINILPSLSTKCFVCDEHIRGKPIHLVMGHTAYSNASFPSKIGELVGNDFMVVVSMEDVLCGKCATLLNHLDKLERDLRLVRRTLTGYLASKYHINHEDLFAKCDKSGAREKNNANATETAKKADKLYLCELCNFSTRDKNQVLVHFEECLTLPHACTLCPKRFASIQDHAQHAVMVHNLTWSCQICCSLFVCEEQVSDHMKTHPHCTVCNTAFAEQAQVDEHREKEHPVVEVGTLVIEGATDTGEAYLQELVNESDSKPRGISEDTTEIEFHTCSLCALTFLKAFLFNEHMKMHRNVKQDTQTDNSATENRPSDVYRIEHDLEDLFEKLHAETVDLTQSEKPFTSSNGYSDQSKTDPNFSLFNNPKEETMSGIAIEIQNQSNQATQSDCTSKSSSAVSHGKNVKSPSEKLKRLTKSVKVKVREQCCLCCKSFYSKHRLRSHLEGHLKSGHSKCSVCSEMVSGLATLLEHCGKHPPKEHRRFKCRFCCLTFTNKLPCSSHEETHTDVFVFACANCDRRFMAGEELDEHMARLHRTDHQCRYCGKQIKDLQALRSHERRHANLPQEFDCDVCHRVFKTKSGLHNHSAVHTGQFKYCCDFCGKGFMTCMMFEEHRRRHTKEQRYVCDVCGRKFSFQSTYWIHRKWHDNPYPYKCNYCGKLFRHTSLLAAHKRKHTGERPYKCSHCPLTFAVGTSLKRHLILHTGAYPYKCKNCNSGFTTKYKYSLHRAKVHDDYELLNRKSATKDFKMAVHETEEGGTQAETVHTWELMNGIVLDQVLGERVENETQGDPKGSMVVDTTAIALSGIEDFSSDTRLVEIVMDDSYQAVATVTLAGVADTNGIISEAWYN